MLYAIGLLSENHPREALRIAKKYLEPTVLDDQTSVGGER
jgi:hypothetical protein